MLTTTKKQKLQQALKAYCKKYLNGNITDLDESGTRLMINSFLTDVLGYAALEEVKTEYMIKGTYADYMIQSKGQRYMLVEVKAFSLALSEKHLRQAVNYGANEGVEWALLTNGKNFELYRILFEKPINSKKVFAVDLTDPAQLKQAIELLQFIHRDSVFNKGLDFLWNKNCALDPAHVAGLLYAPQITGFIRKTLKDKFKCKFEEEEIIAAINRIIHERVNAELVKPFKVKAGKAKKPAAPAANALTILQEQLPADEAVQNLPPESLN